MEDQFSYDEEIGCVGVHSLLDLIKKKSINPEFCIVGEPTSMEMVIGHKGKHAYDVKVDGLSCHSGQAPYGVNAINYASKLINYIEEINKEKYITFQPNTITYAVPSASKLASTMRKANVGVVWHTTYSGSSLSDMSASFGADISSLKKSSKVWMDNAEYNDVSGTATLTVSKNRFCNLKDRSLNL